MVVPLWPGAGKAAKRVIIAGCKGSGAPLTLVPGLTCTGRMAVTPERRKPSCGMPSLWSSGPGVPPLDRRPPIPNFPKPASGHRRGPLTASESKSFECARARLVASLRTLPKSAPVVAVVPLAGIIGRLGPFQRGLSLTRSGGDAGARVQARGRQGRGHRRQLAGRIAGAVGADCAPHSRAGDRASPAGLRLRRGRRRLRWVLAAHRRR